MRRRFQLQNFAPAAAFLALTAAVTAGCDRRAPSRAQQDPSVVVVPAAVAPDAGPTERVALPARAERILVPGDSAATVVRGPHGETPKAVFMPGVCSNALGYIQSFQSAAQKFGGVVAIDGDAPCPGAGPAFHTFSWDAARQHARIEAALAAAGAKEIPAGGITVVGYSQGAAIAEQLVARWPDRYTRVVLIGSPADPSPTKLRSASAVVTMSCSLDMTWRMRGAAVSLSRRGTPATYLEMPGCRHGQVADAERVFGEAFRWLDDNARPRAAAAPTPIVGRLEG
jgi:pimeloyl-ACP methyl ester carboxylesterase